jgi:hypothetical protein
MTHDHGPLSRWQRMSREYAGDEDRPLASYALLIGGYSSLAGALLLAGRRYGDRRLDRVRVADLALLGVATHKVARLIAKDPVTSPLRAPFTRFAGTSGEAELAEEVRGTGLRKAIGELVTCPFCMGQWVATGFTFGYVVAPRLTRLLAAVMVELTIADFLQLGYAAAQEKQTSG